jgi:hypothetical protein
LRRTYFLALPERYDPNTPYALVLGFHGSGANGEALRADLNIEALSGSAAIFAYPDGLEVSSGGTGWLTKDGRDAVFIDALVVERDLRCRFQLRRLDGERPGVCAPRSSARHRFDRRRWSDDRLYRRRRGDDRSRGRRLQRTDALRRRKSRSLAANEWLPDQNAPAPISTLLRVPGVPRGQARHLVPSRWRTRNT